MSFKKPIAGFVKSFFLFFTLIKCMVQIWGKGPTHENCRSLPSLKAEKFDFLRFWGFRGLFGGFRGLLGGFRWNFWGIKGVGSIQNKSNKWVWGPCKNPRSLSTPKAEKFDFRRYFVFFTQFYGQKKFVTKTNCAQTEW